jgi:hypothetical protein
MSKSKSSERTTDSARLQLAAKKAALRVQAEELEKSYELEMEGLKLKFKAKKQEMECNIKMAEAEERVLAEGDLEGYVDPSERIPVVGLQEEEKKRRKTVEDWFERNEEHDKELQYLTNEKKESKSKEQQGNIVSKGNTRHEGDDDEEMSEEALGRKLVKCMIDSQKYQQRVADFLQLPRTELKPFSGDPLQYWPFIRAFEAALEKETVESSAKLARLIYYCSGKPKQVIESCAAMDSAKGYQTARRLLKERFGQNHIITSAWLRNY